jgi:hypothetical protein
MKTYQEFVSEALMARPSLVPASLNKPQPAAVQNAQKSIVRRPVPATKPVNTNTATATAGTTPTATAAAGTAGTKRPSLMQQAQELRAMRMRSMQRQGNTAGASAVRKTLPTAVAGASDQRAQQLNRVRNQARSATIANARGGQGMMGRSPVVQQQQRPAAAGTVPPARPTAAAAGTTPTPTSQKPDIFTDTPVGGKPYGNAAAAAGTRPAVQQQQKPVVQQQRKPQVGDKVTDPEILKMIDQEKEIGRTGRMPTNVKPIPIQQQQNNNQGLVNVKTDAGVTTGVDPSTGEKKLIQSRSPQQQQQIKSALNIPGSTTNAAAAGTGTNTSQLSDDMIGKAFAARKATMMRGDGGEYSNMGKTPEEFRAKFNSLPPNGQRAILRRLAQ